MSEAWHWYRAWEGGREQGYREWQEEGIAPPAIIWYPILKMPIYNNHFAPVTKSHSIEEFLPSSFAEPLVSLPGAVHKITFRGGKM